MNIEELKKWIGSSEKSEDIITSSLEQRFRATLDIDPGDPNLLIDSSTIFTALSTPAQKPLGDARYKLIFCFFII